MNAPLHLPGTSPIKCATFNLGPVPQVSAGPRDKEGWAKRFREASPDCGCHAGCNGALARHMTLVDVIALYRSFRH